MIRSKLVNLFVLVSIILCGTSCDSTKHEITLVATSYAESFYNYDYKTAAQFVTNESKHIIVFYSSNVSQSDLDQYNHSKKIKVEIEDVKLNDEYNEATVTMKITNMLKISLLNKPDTTIKEKEIHLDLKLVDGKWLVDLTSTK
jgi:hypothetical protein